MNFSAFKELRRRKDLVNKLALLPQGFELVNNFETDDSRWPMASLFLLSPSFFPPYRGIKIRREILYIKWNLVVRGSWSSFFMYLQYCIVVQICCTCAVNKNTRRTTGTRRDTHHGHKKGTHPRASQGRALMC